MTLLMSGRYGDPFNPWGDIMTIAESWCVSSPNAKLVIAVPTTVSLGKDIIMFNAHRIYGPVMYSYLVSSKLNNDNCLKTYF